MKTILIVDDSPTIRRMVHASLSSRIDADYQQAVNGLEAIEKLALSPIDLMVLDINMPDIHGIEVMQFMQKHQLYNKIPVIVLTTRGDTESRDMMLQSGATFYLTKPFDPEQLIDYANQILLDRGLE